MHAGKKKVHRLTTDAAVMRAEAASVASLARARARTLVEHADMYAQTLEARAAAAEAQARAIEAMNVSVTDSEGEEVVEELPSSSTQRCSAELSCSESDVQPVSQFFDDSVAASIVDESEAARAAHYDDVGARELLPGTSARVACWMAGGSGVVYGVGGAKREAAG
jgi:hypothetical protein